MNALIVVAVVVGAVVAFSAIAEAIRRMRKAARPEADLEPPQWSDEEIDRLREVMRKDGDAQ